MATPTKKLEWPKGKAPKDAVAEAFANVAAYAISMSEANQGRDPKTAVHEYRKSVRRGRALVKLSKKQLGRQYTGLNKGLGELARQTSELRDNDVLLDVLANLPAIENPAFLRARQELEHALRSRVVDADGALDLLASTRVSLDSFGATLRDELESRFDWGALRAGVKKSYARARKCRQQAKSGDDAAVHNWRKRTKELRYQIELLSTLGLESGQVHKVLDNLSELATQLGKSTDKMVLCDNASSILTQPDDFVSEVRQLIQSECAIAFDNSERFFEPTPEAFVSSLKLPTSAKGQEV